MSARILKAVYFPNNSILDATLGSHPSQIWRSIIEGRDVLTQGLIRRTRERRSTGIWGHNWLPREGSIRPITTACAGNLFYVSDLIDATTASWKDNVIRDVFLLMQGFTNFRGALPQLPKLTAYSPNKVMQADYF